MWQIVAHPEPTGRGFSVQAIFDDARGDKCATCSREAFKTELLLEGGALRDTFGTPDLTDDIIFRNESDRAVRTNSGMQAGRAFLQLISNGSCEEAYAMATSRWRTLATKGAWTAECRRISQALGHVNSRTTQEKHFVSRVTEGNQYRRGEFVFLAIHVVSDNGSAIEFLVLEREGNDWRIGMYYVA
ncbi:MAG TPA: DUF4019 domain-containing protein [Thermoanaerobaculia bacterium]|nr:DUF4019 domain-containing protein [Thermoanaerobaculia bacterium]